MSRTSPADGIRFAFGTLTALPVRVNRWDREAARAGMQCAPLAGLVVGLCAAGLGGALTLLGAGPLLAAAATAAVPAALTRGLHLDGLADTADGLGSAKPADEALRIMKQSDIGPFGVITLLFVLLAQVAVFFELYERSWTEGAVAASRRGRRRPPRPHPGRPHRSAPGPPRRPRRCRRRGRPARSCAAGRGGRHGRGGAGAGALLGPYGMARTAACVVLAVGAAELLLRHCVRRFGGVTGDVFGGLAETAATTALVVLALG